VARALSEDIARRHQNGEEIDFILISGDLAFSGKEDQYALAAAFCDSLCAACDIPKERVFCIPGNHDIDRNKQKLAFLGGRTLRDQTAIDSLLDPADDVETLLKREANYRAFQLAYFAGQDRTVTSDGLGYVSFLTIDGVTISILGLDSAWLAEGDVGDHGKLLIGERQVLNALDILDGAATPAHVVIGMVHHPLHLLQEFDRYPVQYRLEKVCNFIHCGHLHQAEARVSGLTAGGCLTLLGGAQFETRQSSNTYSVVSLDLQNGDRTVETIQYDPIRSEFRRTETTQYRIDLIPTGSCTLAELSDALREHDPELGLCPHYLAALLLDQKAELAISDQDDGAFASFAVLEALPNGELKRTTTAFMTFRNVLRVLYPRMSLREILIQHGDALVEYGAFLAALSRRNPAFARRISELESDASRLTVRKESVYPRHAVDLLFDLAADNEWDLLRFQSQRYLSSPDEAVSFGAKTMLAVALAHSDQAQDREVSVNLYKELYEDRRLDPTGISNFVTLLMDLERYGEAKAAILEGMQRMPQATVQLQELGQQLISQTGDRAFRDQLRAALNAMAPRGGASG
jgi:predicted phosphodiesterase